MTIVLNDPSWWPIIDFQRFFSYWMCFSYQLVIFRSNNDLHLAVATGVVVVYDWGEQDAVLILLPFL
jgi:uncharacterized membrane protein YraQ (UPF0718 family)